MALKKASEAIPTSDGERLDLDALAKEGAAVVISHRGFGETKDYGQGEVTPIRARVIVLTGAETGRVDDDALIFKAGIRVKLGEQGDDTVGRLGTYGTRKAVGLEKEQSGDVELALAALEQANAAASKPAEKKEPAMAGAASKTAASVVGDASAEGEDPDF